MQAKQQVLNLPVYQPGKPIEEVKRELGLTKVIKLASNENPFGCSSKAKEAILADLEHLSLYPDGAGAEVTRAVAEHYGFSADQLIFGTGSDDVILMIARAYLLPGDETIMASHTFPQYKHNAEIEGAVSIQVPLKDGKHDLDAMLECVTERTKIIWVCNPNNPTGTIVSHDELLAFIAKIPPSVMVVLDEAYYEYATTAEYPQSLELLQAYPNLVILRTFSKIYGLAALRVGYGIGRPDVIRTINQVREPFNTSRLAQAAAAAAIRDQQFVDQCRVRNAEGLKYLETEFQRLKLTFFPAHGNFIMVDIGRPSGPVFDALLKQGIIVRSGEKLDFPTMLRVTVGSREQNEAFLHALEGILQDSPKIHNT
ncbi:histidinol-phosphate transaminase [Paenibacillus sp. FJAT-26967]|uniref:histidinol-phosphate transaminase n=1 Tax=Paenibacillus sp. FJAT-26967 TaxID=1729690 RepID=UPI0008390B56|nr:histidinol-phosphate transaminase [Paenibacillus sp. FJAT-26967]